MASSKAYLDFILEQLSDLDGITCRPMMGEFILYYRGKIIGGVYDDRFLIKAADAAVRCIPNPRYELPYEGVKKMILVEDIDNKAFLADLLSAMYDELPAPKERKSSRR